MRRRAQTLNSLLRHQVLSRYKAYLVILHVRIHNYSTVLFTNNLCKMWGPIVRPHREGKMVRTEGQLRGLGSSSSSAIAW